MFNSNVQPKRRVRVTPTAWLCTCGKPAGPLQINDARLMRCPVCGVARHQGPAATAGQTR